MPVTVHKILILSVEVIKLALLPIGMLSEEAIEARHKHIRKYREGHAIKMSRESNIQDVLNFLLVSSDPVIFVQTPFRQKHKRTLSLDVRLLLSEPDAFYIRRPEKSGDCDSGSDDDDETDADSTL